MKTYEIVYVVENGGETSCHESTEDIVTLVAELNSQGITVISTREIGDAESCQQTR